MFTFNEIIDLAIRIEQNGEKTYREAQKRVSNSKLATMLKQLADDEVEHLEWFNQLKEKARPDVGEPHLEEIARTILQGVLGDQAFSIQDVDFSKIEDRRRLLELSLEFEKDTIIFYEMLNAFLTDEETVKRLKEIIKEENRHVQVLEEWLEEEG